jgi:hypothetical protein
MLNLLTALANCATRDVLDDAIRLISLLKSRSDFGYKGAFRSWDHVTQMFLCPALSRPTLQHHLLHRFQPLFGHSCALKALTPFALSTISAFNPSISKRTIAIKQIIESFVV